MKDVDSLPTPYYANSAGVFAMGGAFPNGRTVAFGRFLDDATIVSGTSKNIVSCARSSPPGSDNRFIVVVDIDVDISLCAVFITGGTRVVGVDIITSVGSYELSSPSTVVVRTYDNGSGSINWGPFSLMIVSP